MRILLLTQYFPPETGAAQNRLSDLARRLSVAGHKVTVLTSMPNYPQGRIFEPYRGRLFCKETADGLRVLRTWCYVNKNRGFVSRLLNYCSFAVLALFWAILVGGNQDVVIVESPPLFLGITGLVLSWWRRARMIFNVSDLWPKSAVAMGVLHNEVLIRCALALETHIYKHSYAITGQTEGIVEYIKQGVSRVPVSLITNGIDPEKFVNSDSEREKNRANWGFEGYFVVGFTGLHGLAYDFDGVLETAELLQSQSPPVLFAFFGDGPAKAGVQATASERGLRNVRFFPPRPAAAMPELLSALDAAIIPLKNSEFFRNTLPSRLFECMAARLPIVLAILDGEATQIVRRSVGGLCVPPEDPCAMAEAIRQLARDRSLCVTLGQNGHRYVCLHYDRREMARRFLQLLPRNPARTPEVLNHPASLAVQERAQNESVPH